MGKELSDKVLKIMRQLGDMPLISTKAYKSDDGKYMVTELVVKTVKPVSYYEEVMKKEQYPGVNRGEQNGSY